MQEEENVTFATSRHWQSSAAIATCSYRVHSTKCKKVKSFDHRLVNYNTTLPKLVLLIIKRVFCEVHFVAYTLLLSGCDCYTGKDATSFVGYIFYDDNEEGI